MADQQSPDQPTPDPAEGADSEIISAQELDEVLAQASSLAADLSEGVGPTEESATPAEADEASGGGGDLPTSVDAKLDELENLLATTTGEIDTPPETSDEPAPSPDADAIPDFMAELTQTKPVTDETSSPPAESAPAESESPPSAPDRPTDEAAGQVVESQDADTPPMGAVTKLGVVRSGVVTSVGVVSGGPALGELPSPAETFGDPNGASPASTNAGATPRNAARSVAGRLSPPVMALCERAVTLLEVIDRPVARIGDSVRRAIGWVAIATVATAVIVSLLSLL